MRILGATNLPHGMTLMTGLRKVGAKYFAQDKVEVINGRISTTWFSDGGKTLPSGAYEVSISSPLPALQSAAVRAVIGQTGENLSGPITTSMGSKWTLRKSSDFPSVHTSERPLLQQGRRHRPHRLAPLRPLCRRSVDIRLTRVPSIA